MQTGTKLSLGALMSVCGGLGLVLVPLLGLTDLGRPWTFIAGFTIGLVSGLGCALAIAGLIERRREG